ncbi:methyl-accepting chemotaxis protein [Ectothiorhodospira mobilis]|uniref:methyl-accepting chemotaxis protein n=1 Tax=Ectothiorhodospira mobilis TaxID=195064 RepID=UPI001904FF9A|nr:methyl-accepting chemotaxis protein [Ectothiorhodospira mobilis]MBK1692370.1 chemotaxis protein [Ectothiorhodospira mobilis]
MNPPSSEGAVQRGLGRGTGILTALLGVFILLTVTTLIYYTLQVGETRRHAALVGEQTRVAQELALLEAGASPQRMRTLRDRFDAALQRLDAGVPAKLRRPLASVEATWQGMRPALDEIVDAGAWLEEARRLAVPAQEDLRDLEEAASATARALADANAGSTAVHRASRLALTARDLRRDLSLVTAGEGMPEAARRLRGGLENATEDLDTLLQVVPPARRGGDSAAGQGLERIQGRMQALTPPLEGILELAPRLTPVGAAQERLEAGGEGLLDAVDALREAVDARAAGLNLWVILGYVLAALAVATVGLLAYLFHRDAQRRLAVTGEQNRRNQRAILRLLDEMTNLAEGDLTVHATVTEDITGAIADAVNYAIDALRSLVTTINQTALQISNAAVKTQATALRLADASNRQASEITSASSAVIDMADSIEQVSRSADTSAEVAQKSVQIASKGALTVRKTIDGMDTIREQIQETSKRIKRLGESSQEIGDIVSLITDIADQTNILALNAAIQASSAGEAGRGFAVVADEVQRLAERSSNASKRIEALVKTIQADTREAVASMEQSTANVVSGARLAFDAGDALAEIEGVSHQLAELIDTISTAARQQSEVAQNISSTMNVIQEITMQTSDGTNETAVSIGNLASLASELRRSVSGFKLPEGADVVDPAPAGEAERPLAAADGKEERDDGTGA